MSDSASAASPSAAPGAEFLLPLALRERYHAQGHWSRDDLWTSFDATARARGTAVAFVDGARALRFDELRAAAVRFGAGLRARGIEPGEVVVVHGRHCLESVVAILGCAYGGFVVAPLPHIFSVDMIRTVLVTTGGRVIVALGEAAEIERAVIAAGQANATQVVLAPSAPARAGTIRFDALRGDTEATARRATDADAPVLITFSSGTTGEPKGVVHSSNTARFTIRTYARYQDIGPDDVSAVVTAFGFIGSSVLGSYLTFLIGCQSVLLRNWDAAAAIELIARHRATHILLMPTHAIDVLDCPALAAADVSSLRRGVVAGLNDARREQTRATLCALPFPMYGMSESPGHVTGCMSDAWEKLRASEGRALPDTELLICDDDDRPLPAGQPGQILVRGPNRFLGYHAADALNRSCLTADGYFRTGDVGILDADGYMTFVTRSKDIIRRGGVTITPAEIESALRAHPRIADVAVIALPDERLGERACACVITRDGAEVELAELCAFLERRGLARYLLPESVVRCDSFPRTPSLKVQKNELRRDVLARLAAATPGNRA
jgi:cyclohexanecarboxylate-CoA ligase